ncbi:hypothetical protein OWV82_007683 [Melia azedarach]|uniref:Uncharacterized protein n=1 Tax=Melia azedarach TaxID=155640 RepID=A0ACC1Y7L5_MELAZ|nr:hypothetical protein OWV82_007683 [Melia azedarach]
MHGLLRDVRLTPYTALASKILLQALILSSMNSLLPSLKPCSQQQYHQLPYGVTFATENAMVLSKRFLRKHDIQVPSDIQGSLTFKFHLKTSQLVSFGCYLLLVCNSDRLQCQQILRRTLQALVLERQIHRTSWRTLYAAYSRQRHRHVFRNQKSWRFQYHSPWNATPLSELGDSVSYSQVLYTDYYNAFMDLLRDKSNNPKVLFREDGFHLSEEANKYLVEKVISENNFIQPEIRLPNVNHNVM